MVLLHKSIIFSQVHKPTSSVVLTTLTLLNHNINTQPVLIFFDEETVKTQLQCCSEGEAGLRDRSSI